MTLYSESAYTPTYFAPFQMQLIQQINKREWVIEKVYSVCSSITSIGVVWQYLQLYSYK